MIWLLQSFAQAEEWPNNGGNDDDRSKYQTEVETLFTQLNQAMWEQEEKAGGNNNNNVTTNNNSKEISVVFGGKYSSNPNSIPEKLVDLLVKQQPSQEKIYTVSRTTTVADNVPANVVHVAKQNLGQQDIGMKEFSNVMQQAIANNSDEQATLVFYFTLGRHVGVNPFQRNVHAATNFAKALLEQKSALANRKFRVVITGTDATKANTHPDTTLELDGQSYTVPTYKIVAYNYVYAMSKLCQFYIIANALVELINKEELTKACQGFSLGQVIEKTTQHIVNAGENGAYSETDATNCQDGSYLTMKELDAISTQWNDIEKTLQSYLHVAKDISICYTPLHAEPWTKNAFVKCQAESNGSPRAFLLQQVVRRTKNAISIEKAARAHFC